MVRALRKTEPLRESESKQSIERVRGCGMLNEEILAAYWLRINVSYSQKLYGMFPRLRAQGPHHKGVPDDAAEFVFGQDQARTDYRVDSFQTRSAAWVPAKNRFVIEPGL